MSRWEGLGQASPGPVVGSDVEWFEIEDAWLMDPYSGREGVATIAVGAGRVERLEWAEGATRANGATRTGSGLLVLPGFLDLHAHFREPGGEDAETVATGQAAAAHGGFTAVCVMGNTEPAADSPAAVGHVLGLAAATGSPVRVLPYGTTTAARSGGRLAPLGELAAARCAGFSDDGSPVADPVLLRSAIAYAGELGRVVVEHPEDPALTADAEANEGLAATVLGLRGWPEAAETAAVARDLAILSQVVSESPRGSRPRLHLTHLSTRASVELVRRAKAAGLPVTCDVTPHHLCLHEGWLGGDRRFAWEALERPWAGEPVDGRAYDPSTRVNPPLRAPADALALADGLRDGTVDAIATDHAPHAEVDKAVEFGDARPGISGLETCLGLLLAAVEAGVLDRATLARALVSGPARVLGDAAPPRDGVAQGGAADLVVIDTSARWEVNEGTLLSRGRNSPLLGSTLPGRVLLTIAGGRFAYLDPELLGED